MFKEYAICSISSQFQLLHLDDNLEQQHEDSSDEGSSAYDEEEYNDEDEEDDKLPEIIPDYASDSSDEVYRKGSIWLANLVSQKQNVDSSSFPFF